MSPTPWRRALTPAVVAATLTGALLLVAVQSGPASASTTDAAFNSSSGTLDVNYGSYLSKHDIVYNSPNTNPLHGLTVGNGRTGAMKNFGATKADARK